MDNVIKLPAQQALFNSNNRLVDLILPGNSGVYNLSETYIAITCKADGLLPDTSGLDGANDAAKRLTNPASAALALSQAVANAKLSLKHNSSLATIYDDCAMPVEALVRNCSMFSANRGKIEDLRRSDVLRTTMKSYTEDVEDVEDRAIGGFAPMAKTNPFSSGRFTQMVGVGTTSSIIKTHELRINLKDIFNFGAVEAYDSAAYGSLHIHLELNLDRLTLKDSMPLDLWNRYYHNQGVSGDTLTQAYPQLNLYGSSILQRFKVGDIGSPLSQDTIEMAAEYCSLEDSPFYVNQVLGIKTKFAGSAGFVVGVTKPTATDQTLWAVVKGISWDKVTRHITLDFGTGSEIVKVTGPVSVAAFNFTQDVFSLVSTADTLAKGLTIQSVELTAVRRPDMDSGPSQNQYTQFLTQSDQFQNASTLNRSYYLPPQTTNAYIILPSTDTGDGTEPTSFSDIVGCARVEHYRFTLNGESVTNRVVPYMPVPGPFPVPASAVNDGKCDKGSSLHYNLIAETMMNAGVRYNSLDEAVFDQNIPYSTDVPADAAGVVGFKSLQESPTKACYMLALPIPISNEQTQLTIELEGNFKPQGSSTANGQLHIFSEIRSVV